MLFEKRTFSRVFLAALLVMLLTAGSVSASGLKPKFIRIATGSMGGNAFSIGNAIAQMINEKFDGVRASAQATAGSSENCILMNDGEVEMAINQSLTLGEAVKGKGVFKDGAIGGDFRGIANVMFNTIHVLAYNNSGIKSVEDLRGKKVGIGPVGGAHEANTRMLLGPFGMTLKDIVTIYGSVGENLEAVKNGQIDAQIYATPVPGSQITDVLGTGKVTLIGLPEAVGDKVSRENNELGKIYIKPNTYPNQPEALYSVATPTIVTVRAELDDDYVYALTKLFYESNAYLKGFHKNFVASIPSNVNIGRCIPLHPGAARYLKEIGIDVTESK